MVITGVHFNPGSLHLTFLGQEVVWNRQVDYKTNFQWLSRPLTRLFIYVSRHVNSIPFEGQVDYSISNA